MGRPLPKVELRIIEATLKPITELSATRSCPTGIVGEIIARSPTATRAYDQLPEATARAKIKEDGHFWHRMGDLGYLDDEGRLWFCGRLAERVETAAGTHYPDCCEAIVNQHPRVLRSALIAHQEQAALVIEPEAGAFPQSAEARLAFEAELRTLCQAHTVTTAIDTFFFQKKFPVDVRHNAKIHRLSLSRKWNTREGSA